MGLDCAEMIMEIQARFGVSLPDARLENVTTVDDFVDLVAQDIGTPVRRTALKQRQCDKVKLALYRLREYQCNMGGMSPGAIRPTTKLAEIIPLRDRAKVWKELKDAHFELPPLRLTATGITVVAAIIALPFLTLCLMIPFAAIGVNPYWMFPIVGTIITVLAFLHWLGHSGRLRGVVGKFPESVETVGDITKFWVPRAEEMPSRPLKVDGDGCPEEEESDAVTVACSSARYFYRLRETLIEILKIDRRAIRRNTVLDDLVPKGERRSLWKALRERGFDVPSLELSSLGWKVALAMTILPSVVLLKAVWWGLGPPYSSWWDMGLSIGVMMVMVPLWWLIIFAYCGESLEAWGNRRNSTRLVSSFAGQCATVGSLATHLAFCDYTEGEDLPATITRAEVALVIKATIAWDLDLPVDEVRHDSTLGKLYE